jgi:hypothetical protein
VQVFREQHSEMPLVGQTEAALVKIVRVGVALARLHGLEKSSPMRNELSWTLTPSM